MEKEIIEMRTEKAEQDTDITQSLFNINVYRIAGTNEHDKVMNELEKDIAGQHKEGTEDYFVHMNYTRINADSITAEVRVMEKYQQSVINMLRAKGYSFN